MRKKPCEQIVYTVVNQSTGEITTVKEEVSRKAKRPLVDPETGIINSSVAIKLLNEKHHTYTVKVEKYDLCWKIHFIPRNGKPLIVEHPYRSKSTAEFVAKKLIGARIK